MCVAAIGAMFGIAYGHHTKSNMDARGHLGFSFPDDNLSAQICIKLMCLLLYFQVTEIVNVAILTGWEQVYPLRIYAVDDENSLADVTASTKCHSVEVDVLKVELLSYSSIILYRTLSGVLSYSYRDILELERKTC